MKDLYNIVYVKLTESLGRIPTPDEIARSLNGMGLVTLLDEFKDHVEFEVTE